RVEHSQQLGQQNLLRRKFRQRIDTCRVEQVSVENTATDFWLAALVLAELLESFRCGTDVVLSGDDRGLTGKMLRQSLGILGGIGGTFHEAVLRHAENSSVRFEPAAQFLEL